MITKTGPRYVLLQTAIQLFSDPIEPSIEVFTRLSATSHGLKLRHGERRNTDLSLHGFDVGAVGQVRLVEVDQQRDALLRGDVCVEFCKLFARLLEARAVVSVDHKDDPVGFGRVLAPHGPHLDDAADVKQLQLHVVVRARLIVEAQRRNGVYLFAEHDLVHDGGGARAVQPENEHAPAHLLVSALNASHVDPRGALASHLPTPKPLRTRNQHSVVRRSERSPAHYQQPAATPTRTVPR
eukprot:CAMPEP_0185851238 /NCGR_PEP_ID=MMETSP1354-20130828/8085_1 /TAXON_ID=708628 /ORGANISM="Erythrolobus madagascarensis, Strain CCMP3276" /LENGTH=238 /DNA_ID=CAMNT_0028552183 /DNA_START=167 /DNA_END=880 /DNA_ORIENTATION=-